MWELFPPARTDDKEKPKPQWKAIMLYNNYITVRILVIKSIWQHVFKEKEQV